MRKFYLWIIVQFFPFLLVGQGTDSLTKLLLLTRSDTAKALIYYQLGDEWSLQDSAKAFGYLQQGMSLTEKYPFYQGIGYYYWGRMLMDYDLTRANAAFDKALGIFERYPTSNSYIYQSRCWGNKSAIAQLNSDNQQLITINLNKVIPLAAKGGDSIKVAEAYSNIALPFMDYGDYNKATFYLNRAIDIFRRHAPADFRQGDDFVRIAQVYIYLNMLSNTRANLDSAYAIFRREPVSIYMPNYYVIEGMYYIHMKDLENAERSIDTGLVIAENLKSRYDIRSLLYQKAELYDQKQDPAAAKAVLLKMLNEGYVEIDRDKKQVLRDLVKAEEKLGNIRGAYEWMKRYNNFADSFYIKDTKLKIADLETRYNYTQKEKELLIATAKVKNQRLMMWGSILVMSISVIFFIFLYRLRRAKAEQEMRFFKHQQQVAVTQALLAGEEKERTRIARDLHDGLGGMLAGVKINLTNVLQENTSAETDRIIGQLDNAVTELRRIARNMMPEALLRSGLQTALTDLCQSVSTDQLRIEFRFMDISKDIRIQTQMIIYRIVQELLTNIIKHSGATDAFVQCSQDGEVFFITVEDNGRGFDQLDDKFYKGLGLESIKSRVDFLGGEMDITSGAGKGTIVNIELKANEQK